MRRLAVAVVERRRSVAPAIQIDGSGALRRRDRARGRRASSLCAVLSAYGAPDDSFLTRRRGGLLSGRTSRRAASARTRARRPRRRRSTWPAARSLGRALRRGVRPGGRRAGARVCARSGSRRARRGEEILPLASLSRATRRRAGEPAEALALRFAARLYATARDRAAAVADRPRGPRDGRVRRGRAGALAAAAPDATCRRETAGALRVAWPAGGRYRRRGRAVPATPTCRRTSSSSSPAQVRDDPALGRRSRGLGRRGRHGEGAVRSGVLRARGRSIPFAGLLAARGRPPARPRGSRGRPPRTSSWRAGRSSASSSCPTAASRAPGPQIVPCVGPERRVPALRLSRLRRPRPGPGTATRSGRSPRTACSRGPSRRRSRPAE